MRIAATLFAVVAAAPALADDNLKVSGTTRLRYEAISGQARVGFNDSDTLTNLRTTLAIDYRDGPLQLFGELYDSRVWGENARTPVTTNEVNAIEPVQAFVGLDLGDALGRNSRLRLQAGRFMLNLGSRRLVAADDYRNTTNGYTGVKVDLGIGRTVEASAIYLLPQVRLPDDAGSLRGNRFALDRNSFDLVLWGGIVARRDTLAGATVELSFFHLGERDAAGRQTRDRSLDTVAARVIRAPKAGGVDFEAEGIYQSGRTSSGTATAATTLSVAAGFIHADIGYTWPGRWTPRLSLELDWASGDSPGGRFTRFDTLFGMRRAELAPSGLYNAVGRANLLTPGVRIEAVPSKRVDLFAVYRAMWLAARTDAFSTTGVVDAGGASGSFAGHQIEARMRWWLLPERLRLEASTVLLLKGRFLETAPNAPRNGDTRYASLNLTASF